MADDRRERILTTCRELFDAAVPLHVIAPIIAHVEPTICPDCGRKIAPEELWHSDEINGGDRDDLCWGHGANCEQEWSEWPL